MAENNPANPNTNPTEGNPNNQQATVTTPPSDEKKYSEDEMNGISKKNSEKAVSKLLKELGITDKEKAKSILQKAAEEEAAQQASTGNDNVSEQLRSELAAERAEKERAMLETVFLTEKVDPAKISKAVRLIDLDDCRDDEKKFDSIPSAIKAAFNSAISFVEKGINWIVGKVSISINSASADGSDTLSFNTITKFNGASAFYSTVDVRGDLYMQKGKDSSGKYFGVANLNGETMKYSLPVVDVNTGKVYFLVNE